MEDAHFQAWQLGLHQAMHQRNQIADSTLGSYHHGIEGPHGGASVPTQLTGASLPSQLSAEEEFQRLMEGPTPGSQLFNPGGPSRQRAHFSTAPPVINHATNSFEMGVDDDLEVAVLEKSSDGLLKGKRQQKTIPLKKAMLKKKTRKTPEASDSEDESQSTMRWTNPEVHQLISLRAEMDEAFKKNAKKQGMNMWEKLQSRMIVACPNFCKSSEACRKKWKHIYRQYSTDKPILQVSGEGRKVTCRFFDEIDQGFNNRANVRKLTHGDAHGSPNPCPIDLNGPEEAESFGGACPSSPSDQGSVPGDTSPVYNKAPRKANGETYNTIMSTMVTHTAQIAADIHQNTQQLKIVVSQMERLIEKL